MKGEFCMIKGLKWYLIYLLVLNFGFIHVLAQDQLDSITLNGTDPSEVRTRFDSYLGRVDPLSSGYILELGASYKLALFKWGSLGLSAPLVYADFTSSTTFEVGDIEINTLFSLYKRKSNHLDFKAVAVGFDASLNTGDVNVGTGFGQTILSPYITATFVPAEEILISPMIKEYISVSDDEQGRDMNQVSIRIINIYNFEQGIWLDLTPELILDLKGDKKSLWTLRSALGIMINRKYGFAANYISQLAGERRFQNIVSISMRYLF
jgi:hypothetical protein